MNDILINIVNTDWKELRKQKVSLIDMTRVIMPAAKYFSGAGSKRLLEYEEHLTGILHLIDHIQDEAAKQLGDKIVFGEGDES